MLQYVAVTLRVTHDNDRFYGIGAKEVGRILLISNDHAAAVKAAEDVAPLYPDEKEGKMILDGSWTTILVYDPTPAGDERYALKLADFDGGRGIPKAWLTALSADGIHTVGDVMSRTEDELLRVPRFGRKGRNCVRELLRELGLTIRT